MRSKELLHLNHLVQGGPADSGHKGCVLGGGFKEVLIKNITMARYKIEVLASDLEIADPIGDKKML